ncbi:MAG: response regulator, partial [Alphaproteobacteria bacterium]
MLRKMQGLINETVWDTSVSARLLIVDDDAFLRATLREQLESEGFKEIFEAGRLSEINDLLEEANPDLIILDVRLPDGNGVEVCRKLRDRGFSKPILMLTGQDAEAD